MSTLLATTGPHVGRRFTLGPLTRIGRAPDNEICLPDSLVSRYHAEIEKNGTAFAVADLGSKNGVFVNDQPQIEFRLKRGDRIRIGSTTLVFEAPQELKTARFTNTLIYLDPEQDETMRVVDKPAYLEAETGEATALIIKLAQVFETASAELPEVLKGILAHLIELMGATAGSILLRGRGDEVSPLTALTKGDELHLNREAIRTVVIDGKAVMTASLLEGAEPGRIQRRAKKAILVPMFEREQVFGAIHLERPEGSDYSLKDVAFLQALSRLVAGAVRQAIRIDQLGQGREQASRKIVGDSVAMTALRSQIGRIAGTDSTVLITGETGTGKELVARTIHEQSPRAGGPMVAINCAAIPETLIESELFGYERGAFTGADQMKRGKVEMADSGTLFLDEIGEMSLELQPKLLRFLEERIFYRVGGIRPIQTDVRILAATNRDLEEAVKEGRFRQDLLFRLNVINIQIPALRKRRDDIRAIVSTFAPQLAARLGKPFLGLADETWLSLENYAWPGNVRELLQSIERALILSDDGILKKEHFQIGESTGERDTTGTQSIVTRGANEESDGRRSDRPATLAEVERKAIVRALRYAKGNRNRAAETLGIHRNTLRNKIEEYGINV